MQQVAEVRSAFTEAAQAAISTIENLGEKDTLSKPSAKPSSTVAGKLEEKIAHWGDSKQVLYVPLLLRYVNALDPEIQTIAATALGKIAKANPARSETQQMIPALARLLRSPHAGVCQAAIVALGEIQSERVLPLLQSALRNSSGDVAKAASVAIKHLKLKAEKPQPVLARSIPQRLSRF
jgi:HEAT repeat protein